MLPERNTENSGISEKYKNTLLLSSLKVIYQQIPLFNILEKTRRKAYITINTSTKIGKKLTLQINERVKN